MLRATLRGLLAHRLRLVLTAVAIALAVSFISGTYVFTDSLNQALNTLVTSGQPDVVVSPKTTFSSQFNDEVVTPTLPAEDLKTVQAIPGVGDAVAVISVRNVVILGPEGKPVGGGQGLGVTGRGQGWIDNPVLAVVKLDSGSAPVNSKQVAIDRNTAKRNGISLGTDIAVALPNGTIVTGNVTGLVSRVISGLTNSGSSIVVWDQSTASELLLKPGQSNQIRVQAAPGASQQSLGETISKTLPGVQVQTGDEVASTAAADLEERLSFLNTVLLVFALISLFVAAFLIYNTFSMLVAQRTRELALFRAIGATRRQVTGSVMIEALVVGLVATTIGLFAGLLIAIGLRGIFSVFGLPLPSTPLVLLPRTDLIAYGIGLGVTLISAWLPARRGASIAPVAALRDDPSLPAKSLRVRVWIGIALLIAAAGLAVAGVLNNEDAEGASKLVGASAATAVIAMLVLAPSLAGWVLRVLAAPFARTAVGRLARENGRRNPRRTAATSGALMIGLALMGTLSVLTASTAKSTDAVIDEVIGADFIVIGASFRPFPPAVYQALDGAPGTEVTSFVRGVPAIVSGGPPGGSLITGVQPEKLAKVVNLTFTQGTLADLRVGTTVIDTKTAADQGITFGQPVFMLSPQGVVGLQVVGLYKPAAVYQGFMTDIAQVDKMGANGLDSAIYVKAGPGADLDAVRAELEQRLKPFPTADLQDQTQIKDDIRSQLTQLLVFVVALLVLAVVIAVLGIVNTLALSVFERTREIGLLRAVGTTRPQIQRMVFIESVLIAVFGAVLGMAIGVAYGVLLQRVLAPQGITELGIDYVQLAGFVLLAAVGGILAAVWPAWRASRLNVLKAIATE